MLRFTKRVDYGLMAIQYVAFHEGVSPVAVKQIAEEFNIPSELLAKILQRLAKRRLIVAIRRAATGSRPNRRSSRSGKWCGRWRGRSRLLPLPEQHDATSSRASRQG